MNDQPMFPPSKAITPIRRVPLLATMLVTNACGLDLEEVRLHQSEDRETWPSSQRQASLHEEVASISLGDGTTCVVTHGGSVKCWGRNDHGQLGQSNLIGIGDDETPASIPFVELGGLAHQVLTNGEQTFAVMHDGSVHAWGANGSYELGLSHSESLGDNETPACADVSTEPEIGGAVLQMALGSDFACGRLDGGGIRCWGANDLGQLGYGHTDRIGDDEPSGGAGNVDLGGLATDITAGVHHACAVLDTGTVRCWGANDLGQLGYGHTETIGDDEPPASAGDISLPGQVVRIVAGGFHTCAILDSGALICWGDGQQGQLGYGGALVVGDDEGPTFMGAVPVGGTVVDLALGWQHTCAIVDTGGLRCWGDDDYGQLGYGACDDIGYERPSAMGDVELGSVPATAVFSGSRSRSTCVLLDEGALRCWGDNDAGQLGQGHTRLLDDDPREIPGDLPNIIILDDDDDAQRRSGRPCAEPAAVP